jgi:hypothetical protein
MNDYLEVDQYTAVKIEDNGEYGFKLVEGWVGRAGDFKPNFCKREFKKGSGERNVPVSVKLGDAEKAIAILETLLKQLKTPF